MSFSSTFARSFVAAVVSGVLVVTVVTPANAEPQTAVDEVFEPGLVPLVESPAVEVPASTIPQGDFSDLAADAATVGLSDGVATGEAPVSGSDESRVVVPEVVSGAAPVGLDAAGVVERSEFETVYEKPGGGNTSVLSNVALNAENDEGDWVPVDTHLSVGGDQSWATDAHPLDPSFARNTDGEVFSVSRDGYHVAFTLLDAKTAWMTRFGLPWSETGDRISYDDVFDGVDLDFDVDRGGVKETLVLNELPAREDASWTWLIDAKGLDLRFDEFGDIEFVNRYGDVQFHIPTPIMWDSSGVPGRSSDEMHNVHASLRETDAGWELTLEPSYAWLSDPERVYPISVDPTMVSGEANRVAYKQDGATRTDSVQVGNAQSGAWKNWRTVVAYPYSALSGLQVTSAYLRIYHGNQGFLGTAGGGIYSAGCYGFNCPSEYLAGYAISTGTVYYGGGQMTYRYAQQVRDGFFAMALMLTGQEGTAYTNKQLSTDLRVDWKYYPNAPTNAAPANGSTHQPVMPVLTANGSSPDGLQLGYKFEIRNSSNTVIWTSDWTDYGTNSVQVPQDILQPAQTYSWRASVRDTQWNVAGQPVVDRWGALTTFTTNTPAPTATQASTAPADGSVVTTLTPTLTSNTVTDVEGDPVQYGFRIATGADGKSGAIIDSGWLPSPSWTVPAGVLQDGGSYTWVALTSDGIDTKISPPWINKMQVNLRLGTSGPSPFDTAGPVTVNLANGNAVLGFASPTVNTLGGPMGLSFSYNSQQPADATRGLTGSYYDALNVGQTSTTTFDFTGRTPLLVRRDPQVSFQWAADSPGPAVPADYFLARWTGFITVPMYDNHTSDTFTFGVVRNDGARVVINNSSTVVDQWTTGNAPLAWGSGIVMTGAPTAIRVDAYDATGDAGLELWVKGPGLPAEGIPVPAGWCLRSFRRCLPGGRRRPRSREPPRRIRPQE